jgi:L-ascorbate metabolism protein UlaG (beta-lactamase superfamily)
MVKISRIPAAPLRPDPGSWADDRLTAAWLGHATVLLNFHGTWILTDPVLEPRVGIGRGRAKLGPRRLVRPALRTRELPPLDLVLLSHAHMDHTDLGTLCSIRNDVPVVVQRGNRDLVRRFRRVEELGWGDRREVAGVTVESVEVRHWGARMVTDRHRGYGGYLLTKGDRTVLFAGDTAYTDVLDRIGERAKVDLAILPIGAYARAGVAHVPRARRRVRDAGAPFDVPPQPRAGGRADAAAPRGGQRRELEGRRP